MHLMCLFRADGRLTFAACGGATGSSGAKMLRNTRPRLHDEAESHHSFCKDGSDLGVTN